MRERGRERGDRGQTERHIDWERDRETDYDVHCYNRTFLQYCCKDSTVGLVFVTAVNWDNLLKRS